MHDDETREPWMVRLIFSLPFPKRFTRAEYVELYRLLGVESRLLLRRPTYALGGLLGMALVVYHLATGQILVGVLIAIAFVAVVSAAREHLCERLLRMKQHPEEIAAL